MSVTIKKLTMGGGIPDYYKRVLDCQLFADGSKIYVLASHLKSKSPYYYSVTRMTANLWALVHSSGYSFGWVTTDTTDKIQSASNAEFIYSLSQEQFLSSHSDATHIEDAEIDIYIQAYTYTEK